MPAQRRTATPSRREGRGRSSGRVASRPVTVPEAGGNGTAATAVGSTAAAPARRPAPAPTTSGTGRQAPGRPAAGAARPKAGEDKSRAGLGGRLDGVRQLAGDTRAELRRISWPDADTTRNLTLVVIAVSIVLGALLGGIDWVLFQVFEALP